MLYRRTDDVERLQKVVADTEEQFADCLRRIKTLGEEKGRWEKELEIFKEAARNWWTWWIHQKKAKQARVPY
jgi:hypothetical protein